MEKLTNDQLRNILRTRELGTTGNKAELIKRLEEDLVQKGLDVNEFVTTTLEKLGDAIPRRGRSRQQSNLEISNSEAEKENDKYQRMEDGVNPDDSAS